MYCSQNCYNLIKEFEGCELDAYKDAAGVWTIGWGNTFYEDASVVKEGDSITQERADNLFIIIVTAVAKVVNDIVLAALNQNQFDAIVSFTYNVGSGNLRKSTLIKRINVNPCDTDISFQFSRWNKSKGVVLPGLVRRRLAESNLYFKILK